jgi:hypothetical protein
MTKSPFLALALAPIAPVWLNRQLTLDKVLQSVCDASVQRAERVPLVKHYCQVICSG